MVHTISGIPRKLLEFGDFLPGRVGKVLGSRLGVAALNISRTIYANMIAFIWFLLFTPWKKIGCKDLEN